MNTTNGDNSGVFPGTFQHHKAERTQLPSEVPRRVPTEAGEPSVSVHHEAISNGHLVDAKSSR
jgi:hypothetical protein